MKRARLPDKRRHVEEEAVEHQEDCRLDGEELAAYLTWMYGDPDDDYDNYDNFYDHYDDGD